MSEVTQSPEPTSYVVEGDTYRRLIAERDALRRVANDLARQLRDITPADDSAPNERTTQPPNASDLVLARNCLGNLYAAVQRAGQRPGTHADADVQFAMGEAAQFLGEPYTAVTKPADPPGSYRDATGELVIPSRPSPETPASPCGHVPAQYGCPVCDRH